MILSVLSHLQKHSAETHGDFLSSAYFSCSSVDQLCYFLRPTDSPLSAESASRASPLARQNSLGWDRPSSGPREARELDPQQVHGTELLGYQAVPRNSKRQINKQKATIWPDLFFFFLPLSTGLQHLRLLGAEPVKPCYVTPEG